MSHHPEPSEHLGLVIPSPGGLVNGETFSHYIPVAIYDALKDAAPGEAYTYHGGDGLEWTATLGTTGAQVVFINQWETGSRSFIIEREHLL